MPISDIIPWNKNEVNVPVRRKEEEDALLDFRSQMNRLFDEFFEWPFGSRSLLSDSGSLGDFSPQLDITETEKAVNISAELPGLEPEDINIELDQNVLAISGEKRTESKDKGARYYRVERSVGSFYRSIPLPAEVDENKIDATFKRGVLNVELPKTRKAMEKTKRISVKTG